MDYKNVNLFWTVVWAVVFLFAVVAFFWRWAAIGIGVIAAVMCGSYLGEYIRVTRIK